MRRRALLAASTASEGGGELITFYISGIACTAESGMRFYDWILSEYFDTSNPYGICGIDMDQRNVQGFVKQYGLIYTTIVSSGGMTYTPPIDTLDVIVANQNYTVPGGGV